MPPTPYPGCSWALLTSPSRSSRLLMPGGCSRLLAVASGEFWRPLAAAGRHCLARLALNPSVNKCFENKLEKLPKRGPTLKSGNPSKFEKKGLKVIPSSRAVSMTIQDPMIVDRPMYAEHPLGRLVFGIQSFMNAMTRNILIASAHQISSVILILTALNLYYSRIN